MSVDPDAVDRFARSAVGIAQDAERELIRSIARTLARGIDAPGWEQRKLADLARLRRGWEQIADVYVRSGRTAVGAAVLDAGAHGQSLALDALRLLLGAAARDSARGPGAMGVREQGAGWRAVLALADEAAGIVEATRFGVLRGAEDLYRAAVAQTVGRVLLGTRTRRSVAQQVLDRLVESGVSGFVDRSGRRWELASYVEMATRTAAQRAMTSAHTESLRAQGLDLVIVSDAPEECARCRPAEGKIFSLSGGGAGTVTMPSVTDPSRTVTVQVAGSLDRAVRAGLYHPGCRHSHSAYLPGVTKRPTNTADPTGDANRRRLRELERRVRREKMREAAALDPAAKRAAAARVRQAQAGIREHLDRTGQIRQPGRERIGVAR